ncbi:MAG: T9SS type A sorting domain-containing protein [Bacteroidales bacterium]|nr:T9SS type A sorting domain-containing protein [Bacteroidales bacterium]
MKKSLLLFFIAIISLNIAKTQTIYSSDFEVWQNNSPIGWDGINTSIEGTSINQSTEAYLGSYSLQIKNQYQTSLYYISSSCFNIAKNKTYELSLWTKGKAGLSIDIFVNQSKKMTIFPITALNNGEWTEYKCGFSTFMLNDSACVELSLGFSNVLSSTGIYIDNINIKEVQTYQTLDINNIAATIFSNGSLFNSIINQNSFFSDIEGSAPLFLVPNQELSHSSTIFQGNIWIAGKDETNNLHLAAETFYEKEFSWGPIANNYNDETYKERYDKVFKISKSEIQNHINNYYTTNYVIPSNIMDWPAHGNLTNGEADKIAPYCDVNENGYYDPENGDYPAIRGDQALFFVFNDDKNDDSTRHGEKLGIEVRAMAYAYENPQNEALFNNIFISYEIINLSPNTYTDTYFGSFCDLEIGYGMNDYVGYDSTLNLMYGYNGAELDGQILSGFSGVPPVQGSMLLSQTANKSVFFQNSNDLEIGHPETGNDFYNYLQGKTRTGVPISYGGNGINTSNPPTDYMFTGYPEQGIGWNEITLNNMPGDRRGIISYGPFTLIPNEKICFDIAFPFAKDNNAITPEGSLPLLRQRATTIQTFYNTQNIECGFNDVSIKDILTNKTYNITLYPNPSTGTFALQSTELIPKSKIEIFSILGKKLYEKEITSRNQSFNLNLNSGIYLYTIKAKDKVIKYDKIIINK